MRFPGDIYNVREALGPKFKHARWVIYVDSRTGVEVCGVLGARESPIPSFDEYLKIYIDEIYLLIANGCYIETCFGSVVLVKGASFYTQFPTS